MQILASGFAQAFGEYCDRAAHNYLLQLSQNRAMEQL